MFAARRVSSACLLTIALSLIDPRIAFWALPSIRPAGDRQMGAGQDHPGLNPTSASVDQKASGGRFIP